MIKDNDGEWRKEQVAINAYESPAFADDLLSWPSLKKLGWTLRSGPREGNDFLTSSDKLRYSCTHSHPMPLVSSSSTSLYARAARARAAQRGWRFLSRDERSWQC